MKALSVIGVILFGVLGYLCLEFYVDIESVIDDINTIGEFASLFDAGKDLKEFTSTIEALISLSFISNVAGFILSLVGCFASGKKTIYVERVKEVE